MNKVCRKDKTFRKPHCVWCIYKKECSGTIDARPGAYNYYNCPAELDTGGEPPCGNLEECAYCINNHK